MMIDNDDINEDDWMTTVTMTVTTIRSTMTVTTTTIDDEENDDNDDEVDDNINWIFDNYPSDSCSMGIT